MDKIKLLQQAIEHQQARLKKAEVRGETEVRLSLHDMRWILKAAESFLDIAKRTPKPKD